MNPQNSKNFAHFRKQLELLFADVDESAKRVVSRMADAGLKETVNNTPVGKYPPGGTVQFTVKRGKYAGKTVSFYSKKQPSEGGTLRRGWIKNRARKVGNSWVAGYENNVEYAVYVNNGHRIKNTVDGPTKGYVKGNRMLEQGVNAARRQTESIFRAEIARVKAKTGF